MRSPKLLLTLSISTLALAACAPQVGHPASAASVPPAWAFTNSDVPVDPGYRFGVLPNGMRYVIRSNANPRGTALVRMQVDAGSLDEHDDERGYAHYVEHMAFNGSTHVPEGEMVKLLERDGLAFGADTNASTDYEHTTYKLDLPRNDAKLLDTALMLMRETASELSFNPEAVNRERGVVMSEMRDRGGYLIKNYQDQIAFLLPGSQMEQRLPIGTHESLTGATAAGLKGFWSREYVPAHVTLMVIGDFDAAEVESKIKARFGDWQPAPAEAKAKAGPMTLKAKGQTDVYTDPALSERVSVTRKGKWLLEPDSIAQRRENLLRQVGYAIINRRLLRRTREANAPFRAAGFGTSDLFKEGRASELSVDTVDGKWRPGLIAAGQEYHRALAYGFTPEEVAEQIRIVRTASRNAAEAEGTRSNAALLGAALALVNDDVVPDTPVHSFERLEAFIPEITPERVLAALKREIVPLDDPLMRFQGRTPPLDGTKGLRSAWDEAMRAPIAPPDRAEAGSFGYTDFGVPGTVVSDVVEPALGIREVRFANGVRLNLKRTDLAKDQVLVQVSIDGGNMIATRDNPLATKMVPVLGLGGLGKHSKDELDSLLAGRTASANFSPTDETFIAVASTTPVDLELELQLLTAQITDPGYRKEGEILFRQSINNLFASLRATPASALSADYGAILSDNDPRFSLGNVEDYRKLSFDKLRADLTDRLQHGAIEIGMVGDFDEAKAIDFVARTFGALPPREGTFQPYADRRTRPFTASRTPHVLRHTGLKDQALVTLTWPSRDGEDPQAEMRLALLQRVAQIELTDDLREKLGKAYSPGVSSSASRTYRGYGTFALNASVDVGEVGATKAAMAGTVASLRDAPVSDDVLLRARAPMLEAYDNALKTNAGWLTLVDRAQTEPDRIDRFVSGKERLKSVTAADLQALARQYLTPNGAVDVTVLPEGVDPAK
ncbi:MAG: M16 family metallopeptidase [Novosphingobium sp.]